MNEQRQRRVAVLGASGRVGRRVVERLLARGMAPVCQTRNADKLAHLVGRAELQEFDPRDPAGLVRFVSGTDAVIFALGVDSLGATTLFSDVTAVLIAAMRAAGVRRLIAITGVGAGETRGHGGLFHDWVIFPLFTRKRYRDKDRQEQMIAASDLDWTIVRPAPFTGRPVNGPLEVHAQVRPGTRLTRITPDEVAAFVVEQLENNSYLRARPFIGHR